MTVLPVVERELRVASRRRGTYWGRAVAGLVALVLGAYVLLLSRDFAWTQLGGVAFAALSWLAFLFCILAGARHTATCISVERRDGTLGLLFLTDLKSHDITLGKLAASSVSALQALLAILPLIAMPLLLGGVAALEFVRVAAVLLATLVYSLALGLFISVWFEHERRAVVLTALVLLGVTAGPWVAAAGWVILNETAPPAVLVLPSPASALLLATSGAFPWGTQTYYGLALGLLVVQGVGLLLLTSLMLPRVCHQRTTGARLARWREFWPRFGASAARARFAFRQRLLAINPFFWLAARGRSGLTWVWVFLGTSVFGWFGVLAVWPELWRELDVGRYVLLSLFLHAVLRCWIALVATQRLAEDRRTAALELVLTTPLAVREILRGQMQALKRQFKGPLTVVLFLDVLFCWALMREHVVDQEEIFLFHAARGVMLVADACALAWYGMWRALIARSAIEAVGRNLVHVLVLPWAVLIFLASIPLWLPAERPWEWELSDHMAMAAWFVLGLVTDATFGFTARRRLLARFRLEASEWRRPARWARWFGSGALARS